MITKKDITEFFDLEAEAAKKSWEALMSLPIKDRIRKRRAIQSVYLNRDYRETSDDGNDLIKVSVGINLADFKEGECLILHKEESLSGIQCTLNSFIGDDEIILEVFPPNMPISIDSYYDMPLLLDRDKVDLREQVYLPFTLNLPGNDEFWNNYFLNTRPTPTYEDKEKNDEELDDTIKNFNLDLLPRQKEAILNSMSAKDYYLIQGPPGTGKSFVLALIMLEELAYFKHKVVVIGPNHMAINNTLGQFLKTTPTYSPIMYKVGQSYNAPKHKVTYEDQEYHIENITYLNSYNANNSDNQWIIGLTPHSLYTRRGRDLKCDTLIIDEAGQMTIPLALMGMIRAKKIIFAGDHKQLPPIISSEEVCKEMKQSVFQKLMKEDNCTMLDVSFRMCEPICNFVSELFYDGKIKSKKKGVGDLIKCNDPLYDFLTPIIVHDVDDDGEQTSDKEAAFIADTIAGFIKKGLPANEIAVLSPFRAQAANVRRYVRNHPNIDEEERNQIVSDTIDKMQGQEREVIIFSLVSGNLDYMTEMAEFLYNPNKMNVAFSRAKSKLIIVGNIKQLRNISSVEYPHIFKMLESQYVTMF
jgi:superfamily I DNA and/or RNA helicase